MNLKIKRWLPTFCTLALVLAVIGGEAVAQVKKQVQALPKIKGEKPRNVIFILTDDHRYDFMGFTGRVPWLKTPNLDKLYGEGA